MSNRRTPVNPAASHLDGMVGRRLPGGCDDCAAYQVMSKRADGLYILTVHHDDTCPTFRGTSNG